MKKSKIALTDALVIGLKVKKAKYCVWDQVCPGFGVEVTPSKVKLMVAKTCTTVIEDNVPKQLRAWHTLGHYGVSGVEWVDQVTGEPRSRKWGVEDYRLKAMTLKAQVKQGEDPKAAIEAKKAASVSKRAEAAAVELARSLRPTINQLADRFIKDHIHAEVSMDKGKLVVTSVGTEGNRLITAKEHVRLIERFIRPAIGTMAVADVGTDVLDTMLREIREETPIQANRVRSVLSAMFNEAEVWQYRPIHTNPVTVQKRADENKRERNLSDKEIQALGKALVAAEKPPVGEDALPPHPLAAIRLALLTGMRKGEILALRWDWIDQDAQVITIPPPKHKTGKKTKKPRLVLLCDAACALLKTLPRTLGNHHVIVGRGNNALVNLQDPWDEVRAAAGLDYRATWMKENAKVWKKATVEERKEIEKGIDEKQAHFHDLRRTFSSVATRLGYPELWISALLGHSAGTVTQGYARADMHDDPLRTALEAIGSRITGLLDGTINLEKEAKEAKAAKQAKKTGA